MPGTVIRVAQKLKHINPGFMYNFNSLKKNQNYKLTCILLVFP